MKKVTNILALSTVFLSALSPVGQVSAESIKLANELGTNISENGLQYSGKNVVSNTLSKTFEGEPEHKVFLQSNKVIVDNEFTNGDEIFLGGKHNKTFNISTTFFPSEYPAGNAGAVAEKDGVKGLGGNSSAPAIMLTFESGLYSGNNNLVDIANSSFSVTSNGIDFTNQFEIFDQSTSGQIGIRMKEFPSSYFFPIGTGLDVQFHLAFNDEYGSRTGDDMSAFRISVNDNNPYTPNISPNFENGRGPVLNGLRVEYGYAPEIIGVNDTEIGIGEDFSPLNGVTASDKHDGDLTSSIKVLSNNVNTTKIGTYEVIYQVTDSDNHTTTAERSVKVSSKPVITALDKTLYIGTNPSEVNWLENVNASDPGDGDITDKVTYDYSKVDFNSIGKYTATYSVTNSSNNTANKDIVVNVTDNLKGNVIAKYLDADGNKISDEVVKSGNIGDSYSTEQKDIDGYTFKEVQGSTTGTFTNQTQTVTYVYIKDLTAINVHDSMIYVGDDWKAEDNFDSGLDKNGNTVDFSKVIVDDSQKDTSKVGTFDVTYSYDGVTSTAKVTVKNQNIPTMPDKPKATIPPTHATSSKEKGTKTSSKSKATSKTLPKTGEKTGWLLTVSGFSIVLLLIAYLLTKTKRHNK